MPVYKESSGGIKQSEIGFFMSSINEELQALNEVVESLNIILDPVTSPLPVAGSNKGKKALSPIGSELEDFDYLLSKIIDRLQTLADSVLL